ncbi:hypothetical protein Q2T83_02280 [Fervidibacter sacchari]|uniref:Uncharacterized protein n=1 Tax=Candidatus Fervidibacter sacchari TaxID=1448929 RepID=A0ABT2ER22_9BACT|nr:hypothetical protein [Candidatus Fervidibacter sacchari]MCS3920109.1 hypothetical protein [Candidatus Fervidibacter sacchari]WKU16662.1 hypothetical protein Q2T83_02280 [Candidatus Fervidibacter sacchari]
MNFSTVQERSTPENYSPFATRHSPSFWLGSSLALPICPPTEVGGYEDKAC